MLKCIRSRAVLIRHFTSRIVIIRRERHGGIWPGPVAQLRARHTTLHLFHKHRLRPAYTHQHVFQRAENVLEAETHAVIVVYCRRTSEQVNDGIRGAIYLEFLPQVSLSSSDPTIVIERQLTIPYPCAQIDSIRTEQSSDSSSRAIAMGSSNENAWSLDSRDILKCLIVYSQIRSRIHCCVTNKSTRCTSDRTWLCRS